MVKNYQVGGLQRLHSSPPQSNSPSSSPDHGEEPATPQSHRQASPQDGSVKSENRSKPLCVDVAPASSLSLEEQRWIAQLFKEIDEDDASPVTPSSSEGGAAGLVPNVARHLVSQTPATGNVEPESRAETPKSQAEASEYDSDAYFHPDPEQSPHSAGEMIDLNERTPPAAFPVRPAIAFSDEEFDFLSSRLSSLANKIAPREIEVPESVKQESSSPVPQHRAGSNASSVRKWSLSVSAEASPLPSVKEDKVDELLDPSAHLPTSEADSEVPVEEEEDSESEDEYAYTRPCTPVSGSPNAPTRSSEEEEWVLPVEAKDDNVDLLGLHTRTGRQWAQFYEKVPEEERIRPVSPSTLHPLIPQTWRDKAAPPYSSQDVSSTPGLRLENYTDGNSLGAEGSHLPEPEAGASLRRRRGTRRDYDIRELELFRKIRRVDIWDIRPGVSLKILLRSVAGGGLEFLQYDMDKGHLQLMFLDHSSAFGFYEHIENHGFYYGIADLDGRPTAPYSEAKLNKFLSPYFKPENGGRNLVPAVTYGHATRVILLFNFKDRDFTLSRVKNDVFSILEGSPRRSANVEEVFEDVYYARDIVERLEYWPAAPDGNMIFNRCKTWTVGATPRLWTGIAGYAIVVSLASVNLAFNTIKGLRRTWDYDTVQMGWIQDPCDDPIASLPVFSEKQRHLIRSRTATSYRANATGPLAASSPPAKPPLKPPIRPPPAKSSATSLRIQAHSIEQAELKNYDICDLGVYFNNLQPELSYSGLTKYIRGGRIHSILRDPPGGKGNDAMVLFASPQGKSSYMSYFGRSVNHFPIGGYFVVQFRDVPAEILKRHPGRLKISTHQTRVIKIVGLLRVSERIVKSLIEEVTGKTFSYERIELASGQAAVTFLKMSDAQSVVSGMIEAKKKKPELRGISINFDSDPCEGPVTEIPRNRLM